MCKRTPKTTVVAITPGVSALTQLPAAPLPLTMKYITEDVFSPDYNQAIWSIPPPFDTKSGLSSPLKIPPLVTKSDLSTERIFKTTSKQTLPRVIIRARVIQPIDSKHPAWLPATKHEHTYHGCAPNGLRLFPEPSGMLLSRHMKKVRDRTLQSTLRKARRELREFEMGKSDNLGSLAAAADAHGSLGKAWQYVRYLLTET